MRAQRDYDNRGRDDAARLTRRRVLAAARGLMLERGYGATTIKDVAATAGVSVETVYKRVGGKAALLKGVYDVELAGDDADVAMSARPAVLAILDDPDPRSKIRRYAALAATLAERLGPLLAVVLSARGSDPALEEFAQAIDRERLAGATGFAASVAETGGLRVDLTLDEAADLVWTLISPTVHLMLRERGWSRERYEGWLDRTLAASLVD